MDKISNKRKIYMISLSIVITLTLVLTAAFAYIGKPTSTGKTKAEVLIDDIPLTLTYSGATNIALQLSLDDLYVGNSSNDYTSYVSASGGMTINLKTLNSVYASGATCEYDIIYTPTRTYTASSGAANAGLNELTISGTNGRWSFDDYSIAGVTGPVTLYSGFIDTSEEFNNISQTWNFTMKFYNLNVNQEDALDQSPAGTITVTSGNCRDSGYAFAVYSADDTSLTFYKNTDTVNVGDDYKGKTVTAKYTGVETTDYGADNPPPWLTDGNVASITNVSFADIVTPKNGGKLFTFLVYVTSFDLEKLDTYRMTTMEEMFAGAAFYVSSEFQLDLSTFNTSNVTNMSSMFRNFSVNGNVKTLDLSSWDVSSVTDMSSMFAFYSGAMSEINKSMSINLSNWDTSNVIDMSSLFGGCFLNVRDAKIEGLSNWDISKVTDMSHMFDDGGDSGMYNQSLDIGDISNWDVSSVTDMSYMLRHIAANNGKFVHDLSNWDVSNVTNMSYMFAESGRQPEEWDIGDISNWDVSKVTNMGSMFVSVSPTYDLDLRGWSVPLVTYYPGFSSSNKIIPPNWVLPAS